jgi:3-deoxy-7-phosphoheptulonate synthase
MIIVMRSGAQKKELKEVLQKIRKLGYKTHIIHGVERDVIGAIGDERGKARLQSLESLSGVEKVVPILKPYKLASREVHSEGTVVTVGSAEVGGQGFALIAGPCSVESREQIFETAEAVKKAGANILRGGAFKPRTSPYSFQGLEEEGLRILADAGKQYKLPVVTEIVNPMDADIVYQYTDIIQVGARNVQNFALLKILGQIDKPILLKRGMMTTIEEFLMSAEYILSEGNSQVILCERGIRTFERATRNTLDLSAVPVIKSMSHLPIIVDPSHAVGHWQYVLPLSKAAAAVGADGLMIEVHVRPDEAFSDGLQSLKPEKFRELVREIRPFVRAAGRKL